MKKLVIIPAVALLVLASAHFTADSANNESAAATVKIENKMASELVAGNISLTVMNRFRQEFGAVPDVKWEKSNSFAKATFTKDRRKMTAWYNKDARLVGTSSAKTFKDMPGQLQEKILSAYNDYYVVSVLGLDSMRGNRPNGAQNWLVELSDGTAKIIVRVNVAGETTLVKKI